MAKAGSKVVDIPIVDISGTDQHKIAAQLVDAAATHGFVYIKSLGQTIPIASIAQAFETSKTFFASPTEEKEKYKIAENNRGWSGMHTETLDAKNQRVGDFKEAFNIGEFLPNSTQQALPPAFSAQEAQISTFFDECRALCMEILTLFAIGLKIPSAAGGKDFFASRHLPSQGPSGTTLRLLHYPSLPESADYQPEVDIRAGAHSDYGSITLLFQRPGQPGLEILTAENEWAPVAVTPPGTEQDPGPPILVNIGDLLDHWTRGLLRSTVHRVIFPKEGEGSRRGGEDRYSIAFFNHPAGSTKLEAVPSEMVTERKRGNESDGEEKIMTANEHLSSRLKATYLSLYSEKNDPA